eukprot:CAMPEP_0195258804 /NCGR_PEP_ID=MMETSP0706-20130129/7601_1 /TAXON_ID=33640 /ORGANISM="Asterionellopsis glacialis, Strain CCMP134" /LENGTH=306 /DNA_ID=CAMNT_0040312211 /DNA_START=1458 /DNA_END=2380 /DNA_ORIENTATION=-
MDYTTDDYDLSHNFKLEEPPCLNSPLATSAPYYLCIFNNSESIAAQLRSLITSLNVPITSELDAALTIIEQNPILIELGVDEFNAGVAGFPDSTPLSDIPAFSGVGGNSGGGGVITPPTVTVDPNGNEIQRSPFPTLIYSGASIVITGETVTVTSEGGETQNLVGLDRIVFDDGTLYLDTQDGAGALKTAYNAVLGVSTPDAAGFGFWLNEIESGSSTLFSVMEAFVRTESFNAKYGDKLTDTSALLDAFYMDIFGREADAAGKAFWQEYIENGGLDVLDETLAYFLQSDEVTNIIGSNFSDGIFI